MIAFPKFSITEIVLAVLVYYPYSAILFIVNSRKLAVGATLEDPARYDICPPLLANLISAAIFPIVNFFEPTIGFSGPGLLALPLWNEIRITTTEGMLFLLNVVVQGFFFLIFFYPVYFCARRNAVTHAPLIAVRLCLTGAWIFSLIACLLFVGETVLRRFAGSLAHEEVDFILAASKIVAVLLALKILMVFRHGIRRV